jgi:hypothetical protein
MVIAIIHKLLVKRLETMGRGKGLRRVLRAEIRSIVFMAVLFFLLVYFLASDVLFSYPLVESALFSNRLASDFCPPLRCFPLLDSNRILRIHLFLDTLREDLLPRLEGDGAGSDGRRAN